MQSERNREEQGTVRRVSISDIVEHTGLSRATVDRVLNNRGRVHPRTREVVEEALKRLREPQTPRLEPRLAVDVIARVGRGMMDQLRHAWDGARVSGEFHDLYQAAERDVLGLVTALCAKPERPLIITAKNTDNLTQLLRSARAKGKRVITLVSDLAPDARSCFVGIDNRGAGQTAAFLIGRALGDRPMSVGVVIGDVAFRCHEDREIGFRTGLRAHFPKLIVSGEARGEDNPDVTREAVLELLRQQPALGAIYNVGAGNTGLVTALKRAGREDILVVCHEVNHITVPLLRDGQVSYTIANDATLQLMEAIKLAGAASLEGARDSVLFDFGVYTRFNLPAFATEAV